MARPSGARGSGPTLFGRVLAWAMHHGHSSLSTLGRLSRTPLASAMTVGVIGIALALPAGLYLLVDNVRALGGSWERAMHLSVFLEPNVEVAAATALAARIEARDDVAEVRVIGPDEALAEFRELSGFGTALDALQSNPLPAVLVIAPSGGITAPGQLGPIIAEVESMNGVDFVQLDTEWLQRLFALLAIAQRAIAVVGMLLAVAVVVTVGNTIRLDIQNRRAEIEVTKLIGGSDSFIRRPFLYTGLWYGIGGGLAAVVLVGLAGIALAGPVGRLAGLYGSAYTMSGLGVDGFALLLAGGAILGWAGAWVAVGRHLKEIEPT